MTVQKTAAATSGTLDAPPAPRRARKALPIIIVLAPILLVVSFLAAIISAVIANAPDDSDLRSVQFWMNGDLVTRTWDHVRVATIPILGGIGLSWLLARDLNVLLLGQETAQSSGVDVKKLRMKLLALAAWITASGVAVSGAISFIGLIVPHFVRILLGPDHRRLLPIAAVLGATFVIVSDILARMIFSPIVLQTGTVIAFLGSPLFLWLLLTTRARRHKGLGA